MGNSQSSGGGGSGGKNNNYNNGYLKSSKLSLVTVKPESLTSNSISINPNTTGTFSNTNNQLTSSSNWGNSTSNTGYSGGGSYSSPETHIQQVNTALGGNVLGGAYHDKRQERDVFGDGINYQVKSIVANLNYYGFKDPKGIVLSDCALKDKDISLYSSFVQTLQHYPLNLIILDLSNNKLGKDAVEAMFYLTRVDHVKPKHVKSINLSNNLLDDQCADHIANYLKQGVHPSLKYLNVSGNNITQKGHISFMEALESPNVKSLMVTLIHNTLTVYDKVNQAAQSTIDFTTKFLKYSVEQHNQGLKGTKWDGSTVRTDDLDKWKNCKDVGTNVGMGFLGGLIKCATKTGGNPYAMFLCASKDAAIGLLEPDTFGCIVEVNKFVEDVSLTGDCTIF